MGANKPIEDIEATLLATTKSALDELVWCALLRKMQYGIHHQIGAQHLDAYANELAWRQRQSRNGRERENQISPDALSEYASVAEMEQILAEKEDERSLTR
jgi:hypothetical protein